MALLSTPSFSTKAKNTANMAVNLFTSALGKLSQSNDMAKSVIETNDEQCKVLELESDEMKTLVEDNDKVISNINSILGK